MSKGAQIENKDEDAGSTEVEKAVHLMKENESQGDLFSAMQQLKTSGKEDEVEKFFSMTDKIILVLKLVGVLGGLLLINLSFALLNKSKESPWMEKGKHLNHDDKFKSHTGSKGKKLYNRDAAATGRILLLVLTILIGALLTAWGFGKIFVSVIGKDQQLKPQFMNFATQLRTGKLSMNIPMFLQAILLNHFQNLSKTKYFIEMLFTGIVGGLMAIIGLIRLLLEIVYAFLRHTTDLYPKMPLPLFTFGFETGATPGCLGTDPPWVKNGIGVYNIYTKDECRQGNKKGCTAIPFYYPKDFLSIFILLFGLFLIIYHAGGVLVWLITMFGTVIGKTIGKILNSLRCNFNSTCDDEIQDIHTYSKDELNAAKEVAKNNTMTVANKTDKQWKEEMEKMNEEVKENKKAKEDKKIELKNRAWVNDCEADSKKETADAIYKQLVYLIKKAGNKATSDDSEKNVKHTNKYKFLDHGEKCYKPINELVEKYKTVDSSGNLIEKYNTYRNFFKGALPELRTTG